MTEVLHDKTEVSFIIRGDMNGNMNGTDKYLPIENYEGDNFQQKRVSTYK